MTLTFTFQQTKKNWILATTSNFPVKKILVLMLMAAILWAAYDVLTSANILLNQPFDNAPFLTRILILLVPFTITTIGYFIGLLFSLIIGSLIAAIFVLIHFSSLLKRLPFTVEYEFFEDKIVSKTPFSSSTIKWEGITGAKKRGSFYFLKLFNGQSFAIPQSVLERSNRLNEFRKLLIGKNKLTA